MSLLIGLVFLCITKSFILIAPFWLESIGLNPSFNKSVPVIYHSDFCLLPSLAGEHRPQSLFQQVCSCDLSCGFLLASKFGWFLDQSTAFPPLGSVHFSGRILINNLPALVRATPIISLSNPAGVATIKVPRIIIAEDYFKVFVNQFPDDSILSCCPDLNDIFLVGQKLFNLTLFCQTIGPQNKR